MKFYFIYERIVYKVPGEILDRLPRSTYRSNVSLGVCVNTEGTFPGPDPGRDRTYPSAYLFASRIRLNPFDKAPDWPAWKQY